MLKLAVHDSRKTIHYLDITSLAPSLAWELRLDFRRGGVPREADDAPNQFAR